MRYKKRKTENGKLILFFILTVLIGASAAIYFIYFTFTVFMSRSSGVSDSGGFRLYFMARDLEEVAGAGALCEISCDLTPDENRSPDETARMLLEALLNGPKDDDLRSPFPVGTVARSLELRGSRAVADFSEPYGSLSGVALTLGKSRKFHWWKSGWRDRQSRIGKSNLLRRVIFYYCRTAMWSGAYRFVYRFRTRPGN